MKLTAIFALFTVAHGIRIGQEPADPAPTEDGSSEPQEPVDPFEARIIQALIKGCPTEVQALWGCFDEDDAALMSCTNCAWKELKSAEGGKPACADGIEGWLDEGFAACENCSQDCAEPAKNVYSCGIPKICGKTPSLEIA